MLDLKFFKSSLQQPIKRAVATVTPPRGNVAVLAAVSNDTSDNLSSKF
jgi:hypothetical protein